MEAKLASSAWQVVRAKNHREQRTTMRKKTIFGIPGRLSFSPPLSLSFHRFPSLSAFLPNSLSHSLSRSLAAACVYLRLATQCLLLLLLPVAYLLVWPLLLLPLCCCCRCCCVVAGVAAVLCWRLQCNKSVLTHLFSNFFCYYFRHQQCIFAIVRQL